MPQTPALPATRFRNFGAFGPVYEVIGVEQTLPDGDELVLVRLVESGEELLYRRSELLRDPEAA